MSKEPPNAHPSEPGRGRRGFKIGPGGGGKVGGEALRRAENLGGEALHAAEKVGGEALHAAGVLRTEPFWQAQAALVGALVLYLTLPSKLVLGPNWLMPALELLLIG